MERCLGNFLPYGTLVVNVLGSLALGWLATVFLDRPEINIALRLGIAVGFLGAFTTFSAFSFESVQLMLNGAAWRAALNVAANTVVCLGMCYLGMQLARLS
jgi:CrcB protein